MSELSWTPGVDVSRWQGAMDWQKAREAGARFAFIRATDGTGYVDPFLEPNVSAAQTAGILTGCFHLFRPGSSPVDQAVHFSEHLPGGLMLPPVLDLEIHIYYEADVAHAVWTWLREVERCVSRRPLIYTNLYWWNRYVGNVDWAKNYDLWMAQPTSAPEPTLPAPWTSWRFWQYASRSDGPEYGASSPYIDHNWFAGDLNALRAYCGLPPEGMVSLTRSWNLRREPNLDPETVIATLPAGTRLNVVGAATGAEFHGSNRWLRVEGFIHEEGIQ